MSEVAERPAFIPGIFQDHAAAEPEPVTVKRWRCPFCRRSRSSRKATAQHIARCWLNPAVRSCKTCANYEVVPSGDWCFPGRPCNCNDGYTECHAGVADPGISEGKIMTACPLWALREEVASA